MFSDRHQLAFAEHLQHVDGRVAACPWLPIHCDWLKEWRELRLLRVLPLNLQPIKQGLGVLLRKVVKVRLGSRVAVELLIKNVA